MERKLQVQTEEVVTTETVKIQIHSKSGVEKYSFPSNFSGQITLNFNLGGFAGAKKVEELK